MDSLISHISINALVRHLRIDKIAITMQLRNEFQWRVLSDWLGRLEDEGIIRPAGPNSKLVKRYQLAFLIPMAGGKHATIQMAPYDQRCRFVRIEFNPCRMTCGGVHVMEILQGILGRVWANLPMAIEREGSITRIDFAVDFDDVSMRHVDFFHRRKPAIGEPYSDHQGRPTGRYIGVRTSDCYAVLYDKKLEIRVHQHRFLRRERTRFEVRCANVGPVSNIDEMSNPFNNYVLFCYPADESSLSSAERSFLNDCRHLGAQEAIKQRSNKRERASCRVLLTGYAAPFYNADEIWAQRGVALRRALALGSTDEIAY